MAYLEGWLRRTDNEPEGEHTGYLLEIEADLSAVEDVEDLVGDQLAVTGDVEIVDYPESRQDHGLQSNLLGGPGGRRGGRRQRTRRDLLVQMRPQQREICRT